MAIRIAAGANILLNFWPVLRETLFYNQDIFARVARAEKTRLMNLFSSIL